jgi:hypothetical protein
MGSFKLRLVTYFLLLSLVPLVAASWAFSEVATRGELANTDARLNAALRVAVRDYTEQVREASAAASSLANVPAVQQAFVEHDPSALVRVAREEPNLAFYSRERLLAGHAPQDLAAERTANVLTTSGTVLGRIVVWVPVNDDLLRQLRVKTGLEREDALALATEGGIVAGPGAFGATRGIPGERARYVELDDKDYRAVATPILTGPAHVRLIALTPKSEIQGAVSDLRQRFLLFAFAALVIVALLAWLLGRTIVRSLSSPSGFRCAAATSSRPSGGRSTRWRSSFLPSAAACRMPSTASGRRSPPPTTPSCF